MFYLNPRSDISNDEDQFLYGACTARFAAGSHCGMPVVDLINERPLCNEHALKKVEVYYVLLLHSFVLLLCLQSVALRQISFIFCRFRICRESLFPRV